ncbi:MAG: hypothetical protein WAX07_02670 [Candidatus Altiarchaeia archaeon]|jgi:hypothetical protein
MAGPEKKKHPISEMATGKIHPIQAMNKALNEKENRGSPREDFSMNKNEREGMKRVLESAAKFQPYKKK